jgi:hypothetical protein
LLTNKGEMRLQFCNFCILQIEFEKLISTSAF